MLRLPHALAALSVAAAPAAADVTPREVWDDWVSAADDAEVATQSIDASGDRLVVRGLSMTAGSDDAGRYALEVDEIILVQNDDGTVGVTLSPEYPVVLTEMDEDGKPRVTRLLVQHPGLEMTVIEEAGARTHAFAAPQVRIAIDEVVEDGEPLDLTGAVVLSDAAGRYDVSEATGADSRLSAASLEVAFGGTDAESGDSFEFSLGIEEFASENLLKIIGPDAAATARELSEGATREASFSGEASRFGLESESEGETVGLSGTAGRGEAEIGISSAGLTYASESVDATLSIGGSAMPLPEITVDIGRARSGLTVPLLASDEPQPFGFELSMLDMALGDGLWNAVDPAGILPREPGSLVVDVTGEMSVDRDFDATDVADEARGTVESLSLDTVRLAIAGAEVLTTGLVSFSEAPDGEAQPVGEIEVSLTGASELLDGLVQAGIVPKEQAMGARMMLGMFATPGAGEDQFVSKIRFAEDGRVFVNDQPVR